jgi:BON domain
MCRHEIARYLFLMVAIAGGQSATAQTWGGGGTSAFGSGMGSSGFGSSSFGNAGFGGSRFGSGGMGSNSFGNSGMGGGRFGSGGFGGGGGGFGGGGFGGGGSAMGGQGFGMSGYSGGQNFVGRDSADMASTFNQMGQAGTQFFNQMNRNMARSNRDQQPAAIENPPQPVRVELQVAFNAPRPTPEVVANNLRRRLGKILAEHDVARPAVTMDGGTAVLSGVAATESQRLVLEKLVSLEPGVRQVRNEMVVIAPPVVPPQAPSGN